MITNRRTVKVKSGCMDEFAAMILAEAKHANLQGHFRLYSSEIGESDVHTLEIDFENLLAYEHFWANWTSIDPQPEFDRKYQALVMHNIASEILKRLD